MVLVHSEWSIHPILKDPPRQATHTIISNGEMSFKIYNPQCSAPKLPLAGLLSVCLSLPRLSCSLRPSGKRNPKTRRHRQLRRNNMVSCGSPHGHLPATGKGQSYLGDHLGFCTSEAVGKYCDHGGHKVFMIEIYKYDCYDCVYACWWMMEEKEEKEGKGWVWCVWFGGDWDCVENVQMGGGCWMG